ncbi:MAG: VWA domain-containing protein [Bacteroidales bacterium]|nr:VWA domain-containing protein [Bacteroidales bacterium]
MFGNITFAHPWLLTLLATVPLAIVWYILKHNGIKAPLHIPSVEMFGDTGKSLRERLYHLRFVLRSIALSLLIIALARPQSKMSREDMEVEGIDIVLTMDVSGSMLGEDFRPNRLEAAKDVAQNFIDGRKNDRIALVEFAGEAFTQTPLTIDHNVLSRQLSSMRTGLLEDGTAIGDGLATAINRIKDSKAVSKVIILLTDGMNNRGAIDPESAAELCGEYGIRLYTIGVGSRGDVLYHDERGVPYYAQSDLDEPMLTRMAESTDGGHYYRATDKNKLDEIFAQIDEVEKTRIEVTQYHQTKEEFKIFLILALIALALEMFLRTRD